MNKFNEYILSDIPVLVDFYATWCGPCQMLGPIIVEVKRHFGDRLKVIKIDVDKSQEIAQHFQVRSVPTMMLFQNGKSLWRQAGVLPKEEIIKTVDKLL
ncbi:thioredoxin [Flavobacterium branchiophilum]|uniref:Thioredoxin n=1 Tax=Flavobacterium branchiophilum TaxID=55197 RepID=A0A2H3KBZ8_9FLAO|nr:thioredoxin [Flavobacterium branchiophilum]PDS24773.1 thioredoxin [Flavobacterium branchiophilum]